MRPAVASTKCSPGASGSYPVDGSVTIAEWDRQGLERLVRALGLSVSAGSDFHRDGPYAPGLGVELRHLAGFPGVWEALDLALPATTAE